MPIKTRRRNSQVLIFGVAALMLGVGASQASGGGLVAVDYRTHGYVLSAADRLRVDRALTAAARFARTFAYFKPPFRLGLEIYGDPSDYMYRRAELGSQNDYGFFSHYDFRGYVNVTSIQELGADPIETVIHEGVHGIFARLEVQNNFELPVWLAEGLADLFEEAVYYGNGAWEVNQAHLRNKAGHLMREDPMLFRSVFETSDDGWGALGQDAYIAAYCVVAYLYSDVNRRRSLHATLRQIALGHDAHQALRRHIGQPSDILRGLGYWLGADARAVAARSTERPGTARHP